MVKDGTALHRTRNAFCVDVGELFFEGFDVTSDLVHSFDPKPILRVTYIRDFQGVVEVREGGRVQRGVGPP